MGVRIPAGGMGVQGGRYGVGGATPKFSEEFLKTPLVCFKKYF